MLVHDDNGRPLDATFFVEVDAGETTVIFRSRSGAKGSARTRNVDYNPGLELLLERLASMNASISDIVVDSLAVRRQGLSRARRRLHLRDGLRYPLRLSHIPRIGDLRLAISAAQRDVGRRSGVRHGGGNNTKQIRLYLDSVQADPASLELRLGRPTRPHA